MKKIAIFQYDLGLGGIQKSLINLLNNLNLDKYEIDLYLFSKENFYNVKIPTKVNIIYLSPLPTIYKIIPFKILMKNKKYKIQKEYDITIDFNGYSNECAIAALQTSSRKKIIWCHNDIIVKYKNEWKYRILYNAFKSKYKFFDEIVNVSEGARQAFILKTKIESQRVWSIPNYINTTEIIEKCKEKIEFEVDREKYNMVTVGRICHQKGFDILIEHMKNIVKQNKDINLYIIGDGPDTLKIRRLVQKKKLEQNVFFLGSKKNPFSYMKMMDAFVITSRYEGQGMVILEAKALGLPIFIPKHLEKYVEEIEGCTNIEEDILRAKKNNSRNVDYLETYNNNINKKIRQLLS